MAEKKLATKTFEEVMKMKEEPFFAYVAANSHSEAIKPILRRKTEQKSYPRVLKPSKKNPDKMTYQADKTKQPKITRRPITFFEVKAAYCFEILKMEKLPEKEKDTFRTRHMND